MDPALKMILLHAFPLASEMWKPQILGLAETCEVLAPDFPGFGQSTPIPGLSIESMADEVVLFLDAAGIKEPVVLGGCSMGGYVALAFVRRHPDRVRGLILVDTKAEADDDAARANRDQLLEKLRLGTLDSAGLIDSMIPKMVSETTQKLKPELLGQIRQLGASQPVEAIKVAVQALRDRPSSVPHLANIRVPTLIVVGENDLITPPAASQAMAEKIPNSQLVILPDAGHLANLEAPEKFNDAVRDFLSKHLNA